MQSIQKLFPTFFGVFKKLGGHMATRLFRATFVDSFSRNTIVAVSYTHLTLPTMQVV